MIDKIWTWLVYSSANSNKISLSIKGAIGTILVTLSIFAGNINIPLLGEMLNSVVDSGVMVVQVVVGAISAIGMFVGAVRKLYTTFVGSNQVVLGFRR